MNVTCRFPYVNLLLRIRYKKSKSGDVISWKDQRWQPAKKNCLLFFLVCLDIKVMISRQSRKKQTPMWQGTLYKWFYESIYHVYVSEWVKESSRVGQIFSKIHSMVSFFFWSGCYIGKRVSIDCLQSKKLKR